PPVALLRAFVLGERDAAALGRAEVVVRRRREVDARTFVRVLLERRRVRERGLALHRAIPVRLADAVCVRGRAATAAAATAVIVAAARGEHEQDDRGPHLNAFRMRPIASSTFARELNAESRK